MIKTFWPRCQGDTSEKPLCGESSSQEGRLKASSATDAMEGKLVALLSRLWTCR